MKKNKLNRKQKTKISIIISFIVMLTISFFSYQNKDRWQILPDKKIVEIAEENPLTDEFSKLNELIKERLKTKETPSQPELPILISEPESSSSTEVDSYESTGKDNNPEDELLEDGFSNLSKLIDKGFYKDPSGKFIIEPVSEKLRINVYLLSPMEESKVIFDLWLEENYPNIPNYKITFFELVEVN